MRDNKHSKRIGAVVSIVLHTLFLLLAVFAVSCWRSKGPPYPDEQIGFLVSNGDNLLTGQDNNVPETENAVDEPVEDQDPTEETTPQDVETPVEETPVEDNTDNQQTNENTSDQAVQSYDNQSNTSVNNEQNSSSQTTQSQTTENTTTQTNTYNPKSSQGTTNDPNGTQGDPNQTAQNVYNQNTAGGGAQGSANQGMSLSVNGWDMETRPTVKEIKHAGTIEFSFVVTEDGEILDVKIVKSSFTPNENEILKQKLYDLVFVQTSNGDAPPETKGTLVWKLVAK